MTDEQWEILKKTAEGKIANPLPVGFVIDSPWLPNWYGIRILDYFTSDDHWFLANLRAFNEFPDVLFLPGFWSEFGMCTEPSAFGVRCVFPADEFLTMMMTHPEGAEVLVKKITAFFQRETFPSIDGVLLLDDIIGFIGEREFRTFGLPYFRDLFDANVSIKFLHNDAPCRVSAPFLPEMGVNLFNMGFEISLNELKRLTRNKVALLGNIPPGDVLAAGSPRDVAEATEGLLKSLEDQTRIVVSCGGGMPPGVTSDNISAFLRTVREFRGAGGPEGRTTGLPKRPAASYCPVNNCGHVDRRLPETSPQLSGTTRLPRKCFFLLTRR